MTPSTSCTLFLAAATLFVVASATAPSPSSTVAPLSAAAFPLQLHHELGGNYHPNTFVMEPKTTCKKEFERICPFPPSLQASWQCMRTALDNSKFSPRCHKMIERWSPCLNDALAMCSHAMNVAMASECLLAKHESASYRCQDYLDESPVIQCESSRRLMCPDALTVKDEQICVRRSFAEVEPRCKTAVRRWTRVHMHMESTKPSMPLQQVRAKDRMLRLQRRREQSYFTPGRIMLMGGIGIASVIMISMFVVMISRWMQSETEDAQPRRSHYEPLGTDTTSI